MNHRCCPRNSWSGLRWPTRETKRAGSGKRANPSFALPLGTAFAPNSSRCSSSRRIYRATVARASSPTCWFNCNPPPPRRLPWMVKALSAKPVVDSWKAQSIAMSARANATQTLAAVLDIVRNHTVDYSQLIRTEDEAELTLDIRMDMTYPGGSNGPPGSSHGGRRNNAASRENQTDRRLVGSAGVVRHCFQSEEIQRAELRPPPEFVARSGPRAFARVGFTLKSPIRTLPAGECSNQSVR